MIRYFFLIISLILLSSCGKGQTPSHEKTNSQCASLEKMVNDIINVKKSYYEDSCHITFPNNKDFSRDALREISMVYGQAKVKHLADDMLDLVSVEWVEYNWHTDESCSITIFDYQQEKGINSTADAIKVSCYH